MKNKERDPDAGVVFVSVTYVTIMAALFIGGGIITLLDQKKGKSL